MKALRRLPLLLLALSLLLLTIAWLTPSYSDPAAFQAEMERIQEGYRSENPDFDAMSAAFFAAQDSFGTAKWLLADLGYVSLAWAALVHLLFWSIRKDTRRITHTQRGWQIPILLIFALVLLTIGLLASGLQPLSRDQVPTWADTPAVLLMQVGSLTVVLAPLMAATTLVGLLRRVPPFPLLARPSPPYWRTGLVTLLFLPMLAMTFMATGVVWSPGSWATSPASAILAWLLLNSRGLLIAPGAQNASILP